MNDKLTLFSLDTSERAVMDRTAAMESRYRTRRTMLGVDFEMYRASITREEKQLAVKIGAMRAEADELVGAIEELKSTEPLKTIREMKRRISALGGCVRQAKSDAATAQRAADSAKSAVYWESRKDFWDRL